MAVADVKTLNGAAAAAKPETEQGESQTPEPEVPDARPSQNRTRVRDARKKARSPPAVRSNEAYGRRSTWQDASIFLYI